jgi:hypothetical protein
MAANVIGPGRMNDTSSYKWAVMEKGTTGGVARYRRRQACRSCNRSSNSRRGDGDGVVKRRRSVAKQARRRGMKSAIARVKY